MRVLLGGARKALSIGGESIRAWNSSGTLVAGPGGAVDLSANGEKIRWGREKTLSSPIDVASPSGIRINGKQLVGRVRVSARKGRLLAVAVVPLEEYVAAVVSREAPSSFHAEALSALAVAVRSYVLLSMEKPREPTHDVVAGVEDQVFEGMDGIAEVFRKAAESTRGEVLAYRGTLARPVYHSTCGGMTENAKDAWGTDVPYLRSLACDDCRDSPSYRWDYRMDAREGRRVALTLGVRAAGALRIEIAERSSTGRASRIRISSGGVSREISAAVFRREAGYARVKSLMMEIVPVGNGWVLTGRGYGHGVGMCQWGADGMAKRGKAFREILARYYPGTVLSRSSP
ncbi:MAG: SpoIID/LytB domain-containing protein [Deltaproteobacteria bacterium]|nr:SpoIID/LytB domain-containing protein [Candidatus Deferrimicrobiaceae bacterium]